MKAEILSIGDEVLIGQVVNTNAAFLGELLLHVGMPAGRSSVVGDNEGEIAEAIRTAWQRSDVIVTTGGLGPTHDDVTRAAVVAAFDSDLEFSEAVFEDVRAFFQQRGREMLPVHRGQAMIPACAKPIRNPVGTAPGFHIHDQGKHLFVLPGVPEEMKTMSGDYILPLLRSLCAATLVVKTLQTTGISESSLAGLIDAPESLPDGVSLAFLPSPFGIRLRLTCQDSGATSAEDVCAAATGMIRSKAGEFIFGEGATTLAECVGQELRARGLRLAIAESCTGGLISSMITDIPGSSDYFEQGVTTYSNDAKRRLLGLDERILRDHGAVSHQAAAAMAQSIRIHSGTAIGVSATGIAGPAGGTPDKPVGLVWIGYSTTVETFACKFLFGDDRLRTKQRTAQAALDLVRRNVLGLPRSSRIVSETVTPT